MADEGHPSDEREVSASERLAAREAEADEDIAAGRVLRHDNDADFLTSLTED